MNLLTKLIHHKNKRPKKQALQYFKKGHLYTLNWEQTYDRIEQCYSALLSFGIEPGDKVGIYSDTCKEWGFIDLATLACRAVTVPVYHSSHMEDVEFILKDSTPKVMFVQNEALYKKLKTTEIYKNLQAVVAFNKFECDDDNLIFFKELVGKQEPGAKLESAETEIVETDLATIIYTSGTSGLPKGVELTHVQIMSSVSEVFPLFGVTSRDRSLTFLPFSHILGRLELWGHIFCGYSIGYAESIDRLKKNLLVIRPTVLVAVPRIFEKIYFGVRAQVEISKLKQGIFNTALKVGHKSSQLRQNKKSPSLFQALKSQVAHQLVFSSIQEKLGGKLRFAVSGGAPLDTEIADFFAACGVTILEGYGLTETTGAIFINTLFEHKNGSVGKAAGDVQLKLADDGEILVKSNKVMRGYHNNPDATKNAFTDDGYFKTGDIGEVDKDGFLKITDRKKDLIKTAGGKFVAPQKIQNLFSTDPLIGHIHVHGDKKKYIVALITLEKDEILKWKDKQNLAVSDYQKLVQSPVLQSEIRRSVARINSQLASFETIKRFKVLDHEFSIEGGQLTPSLKMKRKKIDQIYDNELDQLYH